MSVAKEWGANTVRYNINQSALDPLDPNYSSSYADDVKAAVQLARNAGFAVDLALFDARNVNAPAMLM